jgi:hypothetical protein
LTSMDYRTTCSIVGRVSMDVAAGSMVFSYIPAAAES